MPPYVVDVVGIASSGAYSCPASALGVAGDLDLLFIYGAFTGTIANTPAGFTSITYGNSGSNCSGRLCYRFLTGPSTSTPLADLGETNGAVRFIIRGVDPSEWPLNYELDAGISQYGNFTNWDQDTSPKTRFYLMAVAAFNLINYSDIIIGPAGSSAFIQHEYSGTYGMQIAYVTRTTPYSSSSFSCSTHTSSSYYDYSVYFSVSFKGLDDQPQFEYVDIQIAHTSALSCTGTKSTNREIAEDVASSIFASGFKGFNLASDFSSSSQVVCIARKGAAFSIHLPLGHDLYFVGAKTEGYQAVLRDVVLDIASAVTSAGFRNANCPVALDSSAIVSTECFLAKSRIASISCTQSVSVSPQKHISRSLLALLASQIQTAGIKAGFVDSSIDLSAGAFLVIHKGVFQESSVGLLSSVLIQSQIVTTFEYGDLVIVDLRAAMPALDHSCLRGETMLDVRRGRVLELIATRGLSPLEVRPRAMDLDGFCPKISGIEIVCVKEVFDESR